MTVRVAVVQPHAELAPHDERNVERAVEYITAAGAQGADFVTFPESYPGPWRMPASYDPHQRMAAAAQAANVYVQYSTLEPIDQTLGSAYNLLCLATPDGRLLTPYRRTHPPGPWIYTGGAYWEFQYVAGEEFPVYETEHGVVGLAMCSEVFVPEVTRALALRGAELIFMPTGLPKQNQRAPWRNLIWSRAIENLAIVVTTQNLFQPGDQGLAMVAAPEAVLFESAGEGMFVVDIGQQLARIRELRGSKDVLEANWPAAKRGLLSQWHRPELIAAIYGGGTAPKASPKS